MNNSESTRRDFLKTAAAATTTLGAPTFIPARVLGRDGGPGANEEIIIGVIGTGGRANQLIDQVPPPGRIVAAADCFTYRATETKKKKKADWAIYQDYRQMFDKEKLDAVIIATPDHGRTLPCIRAVQHGLDVYAEKPLTAYIGEGRVLVNHVRKNNRILQVGTQQRTMEVNRFCCAFVRDGKLGKITQVSAVNYPRSHKYKGLPEEKVPDTDDWNTWCGPTPVRPFNKQLQFSWMQWYDYSGGEMTNWGAHGVDQIQWAL
ncbi:MAG TPA: Gfo/Idh/MocA family oxidoreductase, partial [Lacipirellulaceae bacterium]|nr:Gfo/Idh/MocA family oxidoreductase [Lacipirellulaceae bacterium]